MHFFRSVCVCIKPVLKLTNIVPHVYEKCPNMLQKFYKSSTQNRQQFYQSSTIIPKLATKSQDQKHRITFRYKASKTSFVNNARGQHRKIKTLFRNSQHTLRIPPHLKIIHFCRNAEQCLWHRKRKIQFFPSKLSHHRTPNSSTRSIYTLREDASQNEVTESSLKGLMWGQVRLWKCA